MSNAVGYVFKQDTGAFLGYFEYYGSADIAEPMVHATHHALMRWWRRQPVLSALPCTCQNPHTTHVPVWLYSTYGGGFHWPSKVCVQCHLIVDNWMPFTMPVECTCPPDASIFMCMCNDTWPADGHPPKHEPTPQYEVQHDA